MKLWNTSPGLSFSLVMYTTVVSQMPFPQFWAVLLFLMFICLGLDTQVTNVNHLINCDHNL